MSRDIFWLRDESFEDSADLADPRVIAAEIAEDLESAVAPIRDVISDQEGTRRGRQIEPDFDTFPVELLKMWS